MKRDSRLQRLENTLFSSWSRDDWRNFLLVPDEQHPRRKRWCVAVRYLHRRFQVWTVLPGDRFYWLDRDAVAEVTSVKGSKVQAAVVSGLLWYREGPLDMAALGDRQWFPKTDLLGTSQWRERV